VPAALRQAQFGLPFLRCMGRPPGCYLITLTPRTSRDNRLSVTMAITSAISAALWMSQSFLKRIITGVHFGTGGPEMLNQIYYARAPCTSSELL